MPDSSIIGPVPLADAAERLALLRRKHERVEQEHKTTFPAYDGAEGQSCGRGINALESNERV